MEQDKDLISVNRLHRIGANEILARCTHPERAAAQICDAAAVRDMLDILKAALVMAGSVGVIHDTSSW